MLPSILHIEPTPVMITLLLLPSLPMSAILLRTVPPLLITRLSPIPGLTELPTPKYQLIQTEPLSVTSTLLLLMAAAPAIMPKLQDTAPPSLMINRFFEPVPIHKLEALFQTEPTPVTTTLFVLLEHPRHAEMSTTLPPLLITRLLPP